ncbi:hypothetical protein [Cytobacillus sp. IB215316]|uniref:TolB family protein n=1 Tax=Cytobacillus sp. IB215316 TaxID=3097354 RepID=UPI002A141A76|nr:hypothetical protein [Cytobacillus sp. IB215316]MDX8362996.1 hypothetical protein [Cytobacillus sp. IB215316]
MKIKRTTFLKSLLFGFTLIFIFIVSTGCSGNNTSSNNIPSIPSQFPYSSDDPITESILFEEGLITTEELNEWSFNFSWDGTELYIQKGTIGDSQLYVSYFKDNKWTTPVLSMFSNEDKSSFEDGPFISPDGKKFFFASNRSGGLSPNKYDLWTADKTEDGWGEPYHLGDIINSEFEEWLPSVAMNGNLYFQSNRPSEHGSGQTDIYVSKLVNGQYSDPELLTFNTLAFEQSPFIAPDESYLIFSRGPDIYISYNKDGLWSKGERIPVEVSDGIKFSPYVSPDKKYFFYTANGDIKQIETSVLDLRID